MPLWFRNPTKKGDWNTLVLDRVLRPSPKPGEVLVRVEACSVNRADLLQRRGLYPPPREHPPSWVSTLPVWWWKRPLR